MVSKLTFEEVGFRGELSLMAYVDDENIEDELVDAYKKAGITIILQQGEFSYLCY